MNTNETQNILKISLFSCLCAWSFSDQEKGLQSMLFADELLIEEKMLYGNAFMMK